MEKLRRELIELAKQIPLVDELADSLRPPR